MAFGTGHRLHVVHKMLAPIGLLGRDAIVDVVTVLLVLLLVILVDLDPGAAHVVEHTAGGEVVEQVIDGIDELGDAERGVFLDVIGIDMLAGVVELHGVVVVADLAEGEQIHERLHLLAIAGLEHEVAALGAGVVDEETGIVG